MNRGETAASTDPRRTKGCRVLFLDDEDAILAALRSLFRKEGYVMSFFADAAAALTALQHDPVDMIISDLRMPVMSGTDFLIQARAIQPSPIRIMLSGYEDKAVVINAIAHGLAKDYIMKPWDDLAFRDLIDENLRLYESLRVTSLDRILGRLDAWPSSDATAKQAAGTPPGPEMSVQDIVDAVERSPSLIARLLRVANSVHYGTRHAITTVREAVLFVGTEFVVSLLMALESFEAPQHGVSPEGRELIERLWLIAQRRATIAKAIATRWTGYQGRHIAYIAALFQDIGFIVRAQTDPQALRALLRRVDTEGMPIIKADAATFPITHDHMGGTLLRYWNFPEEIVSAIEGHHVSTDPNPLQAILGIAEEVERISAHPPSSAFASPVAREWHARLTDVLSEMAAIEPVA